MENTDKVLFGDDIPEWYIALGDHWVGPMAASDVYQKVLDQEITWAHFVWRPGQADWKRICDLETFQAAVPHLPGTSLRSEVKEAAKPGVKKAQPRKSPAPPSSKRPPVALERIWYLYYNDAQFGPFSKEEIVRFIQIGKIHGKVHCWRDSMEGWEKLEAVKIFGDALAEKAQNTRSTKTSGGTQAQPAPERPKVVLASHKEQRTGLRSPLIAKILVASDDSVITAVCRDISVGGMQVLTDRLPGQVGARVKMNVSPSGAHVEPFVAEGVIVRILEDGRGFSFRFDRLSDRAKRAIEEYIGSGP